MTLFAFLEAKIFDQSRKVGEIFEKSFDLSEVNLYIVVHSYLEQLYIVYNNHSHLWQSIRSGNEMGRS
mgnify:CR=1 FL=1